MELKDRVVADLEEARARSLGLVASVDDSGLVRQHSPLMSPLVWDLAHVGNYEDLWLVRALGAPGVRPEVDDIYDAFRHPRRDRPQLELLGPSQARAYAADVRGRALDLLDRLDVEDPGGPALLAGAFVYGMVVQHEHQHDETMLATLQLVEESVAVPVLEAPEPGGPDREGLAVGPGAAEVRVPGGEFVMGTDDEAWAYDNERPAHLVDLAPFYIDRSPVTNAAYAEFVEDGGYAEPRWWSDAGWAWRQEAELEHPEFWRREGGGSWSRRRFGIIEPLPGDEPVQHVCWYEADAYARWAGRRLPTEVEWEMAASWGPDGKKLRHPWGDDRPSAFVANLGQRRLGPAPVGSYAAGASPWGCLQMEGDVWEWTASDFVPHPGFVPFPYREYSEVFHGPEYKVLRGGSWATHPAAVRSTFRNWDLPIRRQIFAGFRCARDG
ncbi:MAG: ergothioneine biosynthesis protein EgtB [Acidimicrobiales bacterium]